MVQRGSKGVVIYVHWLIVLTLISTCLALSFKDVAYTLSNLGLCFFIVVHFLIMDKVALGTMRNFSFFAAVWSCTGYVVRRWNVFVLRLTDEGGLLSLQLGTLMSLAIAYTVATYAIHREIECIKDKPSEDESRAWLLYTGAYASLCVVVHYGVYRETLCHILNIVFFLSQTVLAVLAWAILCHDQNTEEQWIPDGWQYLTKVGKIGKALNLIYALLVFNTADTSWAHPWNTAGSLVLPGILIVSAALYYKLEFACIKNHENRDSIRTRLNLGSRLKEDPYEIET